MEALRRAAEQALVELGEEGAGFAAEVTIERVTCDVEVGRQRELVALRLEQGQLQLSCTCAEPGCVHSRGALQLLAAEPRTQEPRHASVRPERNAPEARISERTRLRSSSALSEALADVVTAVVRAGVASERVASVLETLSRVEAAAGAPPPVGLLRWLGRIREALEAHDVALAAQALTGAAALAADLRAPSHDANARARVVSWLGSERADELERVSDRSLLEVAREWVTGTHRHQIERRYLVDLHSGEVYREECVRRESMSSLGPCPRLIGVSLAESELGHAPRRMRLLQYTTTPDVDRTSWDLLAAWGQRDSEALTASYRNALSEFGSMPEPFALVAPRALQQTPQPALMLDRGPPLPLIADDEAGVLPRFTSMLGDATLAWVAGRLVQRSGPLAMRPLAAGILEADRIRHERL